MNNVARHTYSVSLVNDRTLATWTEPQHVRGRERAFELAEKLAGEGATFVRHGLQIGYEGANGTAWIVDLDA